MNSPLGSDLKQSATRIVCEFTGANWAEVVQIPYGVMTWKFRVDTPSGEAFVVRFYPPGREQVVDYEPDVLRRCAKAGLPVPKVKIDSRTGPQAPRPYVMYKWIRGNTLLERWSTIPTSMRLRMASRLTQLMYNLNALSAEGYGDLITATEARNYSWRAFLRRSLKEGIEGTRGTSALSKQLIDDVEVILENFHTIELPAQGGLLWGDVSPANVLIDENYQLAGLLDFEGALVGDVALNLGYCFAGHYPSDYYQAIRSAWPETVTEELSLRIDLYAVVRGMRFAKYSHKPNLPAGQNKALIEEYLPGLKTAASKLREIIGLVS